MKLSYRQKLFLYFGIIFTIFTVGIFAFEQSREKVLKTKALEEKLEAYTNMINTHLTGKYHNLHGEVQEIQQTFPPELRITLINLNGNVLFDNAIQDLSDLNNHLERPEVQLALKNGSGSDIRQSVSNEKKYLYFAKKYNRFYIRAALPYNIQVQQLLMPGNAFFYFILSFFVFILFFIHIITKGFEKSIRQLRDFALNTGYIEHNQITFPKNELGEIGSKMADNYRQLKESQHKNMQEKQKLLQHIQILEEGICFFSPDNEVAFHNGLFVQYLNNITDEPLSDAKAALTDPAFHEVQHFLSQRNNAYFETQIKKQGKTFSLRANRFEDHSFEIVISDITKQEKTRLLKQEMTGNIAHELRTPVTSIRGYLETVLSQLLDKEKKQYFIKKAFNQAIMLSDMIQDMSQLAKMAEAPESFVFEEISISDLLEKVKKEVTPVLMERNINFELQIPAEATITGNPHLLYSLFRNLIDNAVRYAGEGITVAVNIYNEDDDFYYFSFYDTGVGVKDERQLNRIFERFFRLNEGRTRDTGGSGLGLSIVKNAVTFHQGNITAKNRRGGGLEFLFTLKKRKQ